MKRFQPPTSIRSADSVATATLTLQLTDLRNQLGVINVVLFASADGFPSDVTQAFRVGSFPVTDLSLLISFTDMPFGSYAAAIHHDENQDGKVNVNTLGIPKEGIGFSNNPKILMGVPSFKKAAFAFTPDCQTIDITMKYLLR
ncbi:DUF2141 domain-containing protein [Phormidium tenue FACHB-886]|nr:DUF2141 domain-containing protein [Phormidium tenue FACHB-886]